MSLSLAQAMSARIAELKAAGTDLELHGIELAAQLAIVPPDQETAEA
jgi:hypothetical protein